MTARRRERGFTLIEVMIAILLTAIAVIGIVALYMVETRSSGVSRHNTEASVFAEDKMETLRTQTLPASGTDTVSELAGAANMYTRTWTVTPNGTLWIDYNVVVAWSEDGVAKTVTLVSRRGP